MNKCINCGGKLIPYDTKEYEEVHGEGFGFVYFYNCEKCGAEITCSVREESEEITTKEAIDILHNEYMCQEEPKMMMAYKMAIAALQAIKAEVE